MEISTLSLLAQEYEAQTHLLTDGELSYKQRKVQGFQYNSI